MVDHEVPCLVIGKDIEAVRNIQLKKHGVFIGTSANSATYVLGMYSEKGTLDPANKTKIVWGVLMAALAAAKV